MCQKAQGMKQTYELTKLIDLNQSNKFIEDFDTDIDTIEIQLLFHEEKTQIYKCSYSPVK